MILGVDIGSFATKTSKGCYFESRCSNVGNFLDNSYNFSLNGQNYYTEQGMFDTEYRKIKRENYLKFLFAALAISKSDIKVDMVLGLPISQFKNDKDELIRFIKDNYHLKGSMQGKTLEYYITGIEIYPEAIGTVPQDYEGIIVDIGGRTTDVCMISKGREGKKKINNAISLNSGTIELYSNFINIINARYSLDLKFCDAERILRNGLKIEGERIDIGFAKEVFKNFIQELIKQLNLEYSLKSNDVTFTGGGSELLEGLIKKNIKNATILSNSIYANAEAFEKVGREIWL